MEDIENFEKLEVSNTEIVEAEKTPLTEMNYKS